MSTMTVEAPEKDQKWVAKKRASGHVPAGLWRSEVVAKVRRLRVDLSLTPPTKLPQDLPSDFLDTNVAQHLSRAEFLAYQPLNPVEWWSGSQIEAAWQSLRIAEESLVQAATDPVAIDGHATAALAHAKGRLPDDDVRVAALVTARGAGNAEATRAAAVEVLRAAHQASDRQHQAQRGVRNLLRTLTLTLTVVGIALMIVATLVAGFPHDVIGVPKGITGGDWLPIAMVAGAAGALFSAVPSLAQKADTPSSFDTSRQQALLKIVTGAWSGLVGLVAMTAGLGADAGTPDGSVAGFIMAAALFGASQEALTRFADAKASDTVPTTS